MTLGGELGTAALRERTGVKKAAQNREGVIFIGGFINNDGVDRCAVPAQDSPLILVGQRFGVSLEQGTRLQDLGPMTPTA